MADKTWYILEGINPEPWAIGPISIGRGKGGGSFPKVGRNQQLAAFQSAVREAVEAAAVEITGELALEFFFWRRRDTYKGAKKTVTKNEADATNMQKATEDALQGLIMPNDNQVKYVSSTVMAQGPEVDPRIVFSAEPWDGTGAGRNIPAEMWIKILRPEVVLPHNEWRGPNAAN